MYEYTLITGASGGIGLEFARCAAGEGKNLILVARRKQPLEELREELQSAYGVQIEIVTTDLAEEGAVEALFRQSEKNGWIVECLINNVGFADCNMYFDTSWERQKNMIDINITALMHLTYLFGDAMRVRGKGYILNVASLAAMCAGPYMSVYYASKAFVRSFSEALYEELRDEGVIVTALCPGPVATGFEKNANLEGTKMFQWLPVSNAAKVAQRGYRAMKQGKAIVYYGWTTKLFSLITRVATRKQSRHITMKVNKKK